MDNTRGLLKYMKKAVATSKQKLEKNINKK